MKPAKPQPKTDDTAGIPCNVTRDTYDRCRRDLLEKLAMRIANSSGTGDVGLIANIVADLKALEMVEPTRPDPSKPAGETLPDGTPVTTHEHRRQLAEIRELQAAAADPVKMRELNAKVAKREAISAAREEMA